MPTRRKGEWQSGNLTPRWKSTLEQIEALLWAEGINLTQDQVRQRRQWHPTPVLLPGKSHGWRSLVGCSPWGRQELDMTERLHFHFSFSRIGEGSGTPLPVFLLGESQGQGSLVGCRLWGRTESDTTEVT